MTKPKPKIERKLVINRITDYGPKPRSGVQALQQAHAFLCEEGVWVQDWFSDGDPKEAFEAGMCSSARACSMSAIGLVTGERKVFVERVPAERMFTGAFRDEQFYFDIETAYSTIETPVSSKAAVRLASTIEGSPVTSVSEAVSGVVGANDGSKVTRTKVLDNFVAAIRAAGKEPLVDHTRSTLSIKQQLGKLKRAVKSA